MADSDKKNKKKGPVRIEAILPIAILLLVFYVFFHFFFDQSLKKAIEWGGYNTYGAEVNVGSVSTSFLGARFVLNGLQLTDKENPQRNLVSIGKIEFQFLWDALLRAKFVVSKADVTGIQVYSPRKYVGKIKPPEPPNEDKPGISDQIKKQSLNLAKKEFDQNVLGDMAQIMGGASSKDQLEKIKGSLNAEKNLEELKKAIAEKKNFWDARLKELSNDKESKELIAKIKATKINTSNLVTAAKDLKELDGNIKKLNAKIDEINKANKSLNQDINQLNSGVQSIDQWIKKDIEDIKNRMKIPSLDFQDLSAQIFGAMIAEKFAGYAKYFEMAKEYMPPPKSERGEPEKITPPKRGEGKNFLFSQKTSYPLFWLKTATVSGKENESEYSGNLEASLKDFTTNPEIVGKPSLILFQGEFPKQEIRGIEAKVVIDNTKPESVMTLDGKVASFPVDKRVFSNSDSLKFGMEKSKGSSEIKGSFKDSKANFLLENRFSEIDYYIDAKKADVKSLIENVVQGLPVITLNAGISGAWGDLAYKLNSNLGKALSDGFKRELQRKIDELNKKIEADVKQKISGERAKVEGEIAKAKESLQKNFAKSSQDIKAAQAEAQKKIDEQKQGAKKQEKKLLNDLKKKFKF